MTRRFMAAAISFDLDGTLLDTVPDLASAAQDMAAELGMPPRSEDEVRVFVGRGIPNLVERCLGGRAQNAALLQQAIEVFKRCYRARNGERACSHPHCCTWATRTTTSTAPAMPACRCWACPGATAKGACWTQKIAMGYYRRSPTCSNGSHFRPTSEWTA